MNTHKYNANGCYNLCYCHTCNRTFFALGIAGHRAAHKRRKELVKISYSHETLVHDYRPVKGEDDFRNQINQELFG